MMTSKELLLAMKSTASSKVGRTLDVIFDICQEQVDLGRSDFSITTISKLGEKRGVPRAQSIRNKTGVNYRLLIESFAKLKKVSGTATRRQNVESWIDEIESPRLRLLVKIQYAKLVETEKLLREVIPPGMEVIICEKNSSQSELHLTSIERRALEFLLSQEFLSLSGLSVGEVGDFIDQGGRRIFKPGTLPALRKVLGLF